MANTQTNEHSQNAVPYIAFGTFIGVLDRFKDHGIPTNINRSAFPTLSGGYQSQLLSAFRFLDLIDDGGTPRESLKPLVDEATREQSLEKLIRRAYRPVLDQVNIARGTTDEVNQVLRQYGISGVTLEKARSFLMRALEEIGMETSPWILKTPDKKLVSPKQRRSRKRVEPIPKPAVPPETDPPGVRSRRIRVGETGWWELRIAHDPFEITSNQRKKLDEVIDKFTAIEELFSHQGQRPTEDGGGRESQ